MPATPSRSFRSRDHAEVGVGTLIIFIAMVLVAAVAAAVIIGTSGTLQQRAQATGQEATAEVSSNLQLAALYGVRNSTSSNIWELKMYLTLAAGSQELDLNQTILRYSDGNTTRIYRHAASTAGFNLTWIRGTGANNVAKTGDLVELSLNMVDSELVPREQFSIQLLQEVGAPVQLTLRAPSTYGDSLYVTMR